MKRVLMFSLAILLAACSGSTGPKGIDPTALLINRGPADARDSLIVLWVACPATGSCSGVGEIARFVALPGDSVCTHFAPVNNPVSSLNLTLYRYEPGTIDTIRYSSLGLGANPHETFWVITYSPTAGGSGSTTGSIQTDQLATAPC